MATHRAEDPFKCIVCAKTFRRQSTLNAHLEMHARKKEIGPEYLQNVTADVDVKDHANLKKFSCEICGASYYQHKNLQTHMQRHNGEVIRCDICSKEFSALPNLKRHMNTHSGDKK